MADADVDRAPTGGPAAPFRVGEASPANTFLAIWMAMDAGFYRAQGLEIEIIKMVGGRDSGPALESGRIHLMHIGMSSVVRANAAGAHLRCIGSLSNIIRHAMFTAPGVTTAAGIRGKAIGISSAGSESDPSTTMALRRLGLARSDVTVKEIGVERLARLRRGEVAATMLGEPARSMAIAEGFEPIVDLLADRTPWLYSGLVVSAAYLANNRNTVLRFLRATIEGNYLAIHDADRAKTVLARELGLTDPKIIAITYDNFRTYTPANAEVTRDGARNILANVDVPGKGDDIDDHLDESLSEDLRREGFFAAMERKYGKP